MWKHIAEVETVDGLFDIFLKGNTVLTAAHVSGVNVNGFTKTGSLNSWVNDTNVANQMGDLISFKLIKDNINIIPEMALDDLWEVL